MSALVARNLWRFYGRKPAVQGLDLEVPEGSAYGFIGPNGAGKSTTLRMLATVDRPDAGRVWVLGRDAQHEARRVRQRLGFMPDPFGLIDELTVLQLLDYFARAYRVPRRKRRKRVAQAVEITRVGERARQKCAQLSKGWRQRVLLAKTLVHDPAVLLLDEPAAGLDPAARIEFREIVRTLRALDKTVVVSSHILSELADFCDSVGIIERGRMLVSGRIEDILDRLSPADQLELEVLGDPGTAQAHLEARAEVSSVERLPDPPPGSTLLLATLAGRATANLRAAILGDLVRAGVEVAGLRERQEGLEELFLKVAGTLPGAPEGFSPATIRSLLGAPAPARPAASRESVAPEPAPPEEGA